MDVEQPMACRRLIDGVAQIQMKTDGPIQHRTGLQVREVRQMLGQKTLHNGMIAMETVVATILLEPQRMYVHLSLEHRPSSGGDRWGCPDTDGDGWSNLGDAFIR